MSVQDNEKRSSPSPLDAILANPNALSSIISALRPSSEPSAPQEDLSSGADVLTGLLQNTEMLSKLPSMIETVKPLLKSFSADESAKPNHNKGGDRRVALLLALKPYLSKSRCDAIDYIIKICGITEMFR